MNSYENMREALDEIRRQAYLNTDDVDSQSLVMKLGDVAASVLSSPPRNCDVGTAEEQEKRFRYNFCAVKSTGCYRCKLRDVRGVGETCAIHWAQMPYEGKDGPNP